MVQADKGDENISIFCEETGSGMSIATTSDALLGICLDQILQAEYSRWDEGQDWSGVYILLPVEKRDAGIDLDGMLASSRVVLPEGRSNLHDFGLLAVLKHNRMVLHCIYRLCNLGIGTGAKKVMLFVCIRYTAAKRMSVQAQRRAGRIEALGCNGLCWSATEKCRDFRFQIGIELAVQHFESKSVLENLTQSAGRILGSNPVASNTIGKLTKQVQIDGGMSIGQGSSFLGNLSKNIVSVEFCRRRLVEF